ncbi:CRISPR-associated endonuclease Cas9, partial [hydrothermal vent metagenome]
MSNKNETILGLDLGTASIGWALIEHNAVKEPVRLIGCGSRIFPEVVEAKTRTPKNHARRDHRSARKVIRRRRMRRDKLQNILIQKDMLPKDKEERTKLLTDTKEYCPYTLRAKALDKELTLFELGRALYHLGNRRGFLSNRKTINKKEDGPLKQSIGELNTKIAESGARTLGEYLKNLEVAQDAARP